MRGGLGSKLDTKVSGENTNFGKISLKKSLQETKSALDSKTSITP